MNFVSSIRLTEKRRETTVWFDHCISCLKTGQYFEFKKEKKKKKRKTHKRIGAPADRFEEAL